MTRARGQSSRTLLDREYPASGSRADNVRGKALEKVLDFHAKLGIPVKSRTLRKDDAWCKLYYFDGLDHARLFHVMFGGELITQGENGLTKHETRRGLRHRLE
jgi:hypothetical protein